MMIALRLDCDYINRSIVIRKVPIPCTNDWLYMSQPDGWIVIQICDDQCMSPAIVVDYWRKERGFDVIWYDTKKGELSVQM